jgi:small subunit ribosomal protein S1
MSWGRIQHPSEMFEVGQEVRVRVLKYDPKAERVSLGLKQLTEDPWLNVEARYRMNDRVKGKCVALTDYGAFIELEEGVEGLIHISEMSWTKRVKHPSKVLSIGDQVEAVILEIDIKNKRISLGMKQIEQNPWTQLRDRYPVGSRISGKVRNITNFGIFIGVEDGIDGLVHVSDLSWSHRVKHPQEIYKKGDEVDAVVLNIDPEKERFSLGIKQLQPDPWYHVDQKYPRGSVHDGTVSKLLDYGAIVELDEFIEGFLHISEVAPEKVENIHKVLKEEQIVKVKVISIIPEERKLGLSVKRVGQDDEDYSQYMGGKSDRAATTLGELIREKLDISQLPQGPSNRK